MEIKEGPFRSIQKSTKTGGISYFHWKLKKGPLGPSNKATVASYYVSVALNKATVALNIVTVASYKATVALLIGPPLEGAMRNLY